MIWQAILLFAGVALTAAVTWLIAVRKTSGRIDTTEAGVLWEERRLLTQELRDEVLVLRKDNNTLKSDNAKMQKLLDEEAGKILEQDKHIKALEKKLEELGGL